MNSFVNDNVSESKKQEKQITENQENSEETIIDTTISAARKNNQAEQVLKTTTSSNDNKGNNKPEATNKKNTETLNNRSEKLSENNLTVTTSVITTTTINNNDNNESIDDVVVVATDDKDNHKEKGEDDVAIAVDNSNILNKLDNSKLTTTTQTSTSLAASSLSAEICCMSNMTLGDIEQPQTQEEQQQVSLLYNKETASSSTTTIIITESKNEKGNTLQTLPTDVDTTKCTRQEKSESNENSSPINLLTELPSLVTGSYLPHISSEPTFGVQLRNRNLEDQQSNNNKNITSNTCSSSGSSAHAWRPDTSVPNCSSVIKSGTVSASASPSMVRKTSESAVLLPRRVSFPKSDNELVTGYLEPANPWEHAFMVKSISEIAELYITSCQKHNTKPLQTILDHLKAVNLTKQLRRQPLLSLKSIKLAPSDCEALEEVLKRVQYKSIDISDCKLNETAASALFDMIEYYEAAHELDISSNAAGMTHRGWTSCIYMISHSRELQVLNAEGNPISKLSADNLGSALSTSNLHTLKLEHCGLKGAPLNGLCFKLWHNKVLKELWLAHNDLDCNDADAIAKMLKYNHYLELIDISNNNIRDEGLRHIVKALIIQSKELERRTTLQRTAAIDDDGECMSPVESSHPADLSDNYDGTSLDWNTNDQESNDTQSMKVTSKGTDLISESNLCMESSSLPSIEEKIKGVEVETRSDDVEYEQHKIKPPLISSVGSTIDETDGDEDTEDTVRSSTVRNPLQSTSGGQSMLDKLLSMNSESSSEDGASNLSTDTLAAYNSEDASLISDEIFDSSATTATIESSNTKAPTNTGLEVKSLSESAITVKSAIVNPTATTGSSEVQREGEEIEKNVQNSLRKCEFIERNNVTLDETNIILVNSPANLANSSNIQSSLIINNNNNSSNNNNNTAPQTINMPLSATQSASSPAFTNNVEDQNLVRSEVFEVTAEESDCMQSRDVVSLVRVVDDVDMRSGDHTNVIQHHAASRALDVNKNTKLGEDFDDTHSTDSAFESASEGDISRHLPEEFTRLSASLESTPFDDIAKELAIETATIASESNECLIAAADQVTPSSTPTPPTPPFANLSTPLIDRERRSAETSINSCLSSSLPTVTTATVPTVQVGFNTLEEPMQSILTTANEVRDKMPKVTIAQDSFTQKYKSNSAICTSPSPTPPPPSSSPGGASSGLRRTESTTCGFLTQSSRNRSQSTDSLCSDNSLDGSIGSGDLNFSSSSQLNEKITKNDTLSRQQRPIDATPEFGTRTPGGLKALAVWNNNLTKESGIYISDLLEETVSLELLNIGKNCLSNDFVTSVKDSLTKNTTLTTLGLQSAHLSAKGIETLSSVLTFGGNSTLQRIDIRDNKLEVESLTKIAEVLKSNTTVTQIDIDDEPKRLSVGSEAHLDYARVLENVRSMCSRNEKSQAQTQQEKSTANVMAKRRGGYYLGSRKISLTCQSRPVVDTTKNVVVSAPNSKLDIKRKAGTRLRSPVPSPTTISPSSSPNRASRFQVFRVPETSPLTSPNTQKPIGSNLVSAKAVSISSAAIPLSSVSERGDNDTIYSNITSTSLPTSCSLPSMATISSSTQSIKRLSVSPRSRFLVRKVYEDPNLPLVSRYTQNITPPINPPPTPISRNSKDTTSAYLETTPPTQSHSRADDLRQDLFISSTNRRTVVTTQVTNPTTLVTLPTIITPQQEINTTTDTSITTTTITPTLGINQSTPAMTSPAIELFTPSTTSTATTQQSEKSTNNTIINDINITNQTQTTTPTSIPTPLSTTPVTVPISSSNLQPSPYILSTLSSSSDSSSSSASSSSSSSTSPASNTDSSDSSPSPAYAVHSNEALNQQQQHDLIDSGQCPIAVFSDNDITLTKNTVNEVFGHVAAAAAAANAKENLANIVETSNENIVQPAAAQQQDHQQQRVRKVSWISNPTAVDKLLTIFHKPTTIFQRSSSPESKAVVTSTTTVAAIQLSQSPPTYAEAAAAAIIAVQQQQQKSQTSVVPMRKQSPPSWTKLGNDIITAAATNNVDLANTVATTAAAVVTEQSRSFFDAASKQFRDFSKQVFRQNLSFGNEQVTTASTNTTTMTTASAPNVQPTASESASRMLMGRAGDNCGCAGTATGCLCGSTFNIECHADCIPTEVKQEIKENISPEHTINEETLHTMQKLCGSSAAMTTATPTINFDINDHNKDWMSAKESSIITTSMSSGSSAADGIVTASTLPQSTSTTQVQHSTVTATSGIEGELPAHNT